MGAAAQVSPHARTLLTQSVNEDNLITLSGNTHPAVSTANDLGRVADDRRLEHLQLQLKRSPEQQQALEEYLNDLHNPKSANFHKWGTAAQFSQQFGLAKEDVATVTNWLESHGFTVDGISPNLAIDFSGTAGQVREAFHTEIHSLNVNGTHHIANMSDPKIPAALEPAVLGPVALHDFKPHPLSHPRSQYTVNSTYQLVVPLDLQTIYNMNPVYAAGISGQGQTVVLLERTDLYSDGDWYVFRKALGLARKYPHGSFITVHPQPNAANPSNGGPCGDPGVLVGDDGEAAVDVEWASASAPNATIELASCADTEFNFGAFIALQNLLTEASLPPAIMSLSYGEPESENGADGNAYVAALYQLAEFEGVSLFVSSGDAGADVTDQDQAAATHGINVSGLASTPYNVAVGGTDYGDTFLGENSLYWSSTNGPAYNSALSYVPEIPWNDSCASQLISIALGTATPYGPNGDCNTGAGEEFFLDTAAGSGGPSACAFGNATIPGVVSGTCTGYPKPFYQTLVSGNPSDGVRDLPDISMFAANGVWGHYFVICYTDPAGGGGPCQNPPSTWAGAGGTSFGAPIMAGIQSLINQAAGSPQGNPNYIYYLLASAQFSVLGSSCDATRGNAVNSNCIFHDVTLGDMDVNCKPLTTNKGKTTVGAFNCYDTAGGLNGVLSTSNTSYQPAYAAGPGWDFATGVGTPNVFNLVSNWPGSSIAPVKSKK
ncbi:MAG: S8/S53 family peptidase [Acidobacteriaceae bacterium]|nr:S8/S53 family peptidase [Acidobacteriaceae bacterium]